MILHIGERVSWGAPEVIYLEGEVVSFDEEAQSVLVRIDRATTYSAHLIGTTLPFAANGVKPLQGESPPGTTSERNTQRVPPPDMSDDEKVHRAAAVAVHERHGYQLPVEQEALLIAQVEQVIASDPTLRAQVINSMNEILRREL